MNSNEVIQSLWIGETLSNNELLCVNSYLKNGHEFHLYTYGKIDNLPSGVKLLDANGILPEHQLFEDSRGGIASFADWFRYKLLFDCGGWWVDMDTVCVRFFDIDDEYCFGTERQNGTHVPYVNIGVIKSPAKTEYLGDCLSLIEKNIQESKEKSEIIPWSRFGSQLFNNVLVQYDCLTYVQKPEVFCPIDYFDVEFLVRSSDYRPKRETLSIHLWNEMWHLKSLDKDASYPKDSIYERLKTRYL